MAPIKGVMIHCKGDMEVFGVPKYRQITLDDDSYDQIIPPEGPRIGVNHHETVIAMALQGLGIDNTPEKRGCSPVAEKAGFPIILARQDFELATDKSMDAYDVNPSAVFLRKSCDPDQPGLGLAPLGWMGRIGTVLVVRKDKKELLPEHVEALADFCESDGLCKLLSLEVEEYTSEHGKGYINKALDAVISPEGFRCHWELYIAKKAMEASADLEKEARWRAIPSPYEV